MKAQVQREFLVNYIVDRLTEYLVTDYNMELTDALKTVYQSKTYLQLQDADGELYIQSPSYVYELLQQELNIWQDNKQSHFQLALFYIG